jgi:hypothetical protein
LLIVLIFDSPPACVVDRAAAIRLSVSCGLADAVEGEKQGTVDDSGGIVGEMGEAGIVEDTALLLGKGRTDWLPGRSQHIVVGCQQVFLQFRGLVVEVSVHLLLE